MLFSIGKKHRRNAELNMRYMTWRVLFQSPLEVVIYLSFIGIELRRKEKMSCK